MREYIDPSPLADAATTAERVRTHAATQKARGLKRVSVWVPTSSVEDLRAHAATLRATAKLPLPTDPYRPALRRPSPGEGSAGPTKESRDMHRDLMNNADFRKAAYAAEHLEADAFAGKLTGAIRDYYSRTGINLDWKQAGDIAVTLWGKLRRGENVAS